MAHFAELDENNIVLRTIAISNTECLDENGVEQEDIGIAFCQSLYGGTWKQTFYSEAFRKNFAGTGFYYDAQKDAFIPPKLPGIEHEDYVLDEVSCKWVPPILMPNDGKPYIWHSTKKEWVEIVPIAMK